MIRRGQSYPLPGLKLILLLILQLIPVFTSTTVTAINALPTRDQTPLLQSYFIPATPETTFTPGWSYSHALYITNTYQLDSNSSEDLIIDVENTRYDLQINYSRELWHFNFNLSLINNRSGFLDQSIEGWHDFLGLPQGGRNQALNDQINLFYEKSGIPIINSQEGSEGLGDIQMAVGYQLTTNSQIWFAIEIPSSNNSNFISNQSTDFAFWYSSNFSSKSKKLDTYGLIGLALPADDGLFKGQLNREFLFGQFGLNYHFTPSVSLILQADYHSPIVKNSDLDALSQSIQGQFGLRFPKLFDHHVMELFFSEDIFPGHAPDITFGVRVYPYGD